jgi:hypothetical protein
MRLLPRFGNFGVNQRQIAGHLIHIEVQVLTVSGIDATGFSSEFLDDLHCATACGTLFRPTG